jgi:hypothetical protein
MRNYNSYPENSRRDVRDMSTPALIDAVCDSVAPPYGWTWNEYENRVQGARLLGINLMDKSTQNAFRAAFDSSCERRNAWQFPRSRASFLHALRELMGACPERIARLRDYIAADFAAAMERGDHTGKTAGVFFNIRRADELIHPLNVAENPNALAEAAEYYAIYLNQTGRLPQ